VNGGGRFFGHPLGCSGARIHYTLLNVLEQNNAKLAQQPYCNGGGGALPLIIEKNNKFLLKHAQQYGICATLVLLPVRP